MRYIIIGSMIVFVCSCKQRNRVYAKDLRSAGVSDTLLKEAAKYSIEYNDFRKEKHITLLPDSFILDRRGGDFIGWINPAPSFILPRYHMKALVWSVDSLMEDRSIFLGPNKDHLRILFRNSQFYIDSDVQYDPAYAIGHAYYDSNFKATYLTKNGADSLLNQWGLERYIVK